MNNTIYPKRIFSPKLKQTVVGFWLVAGVLLLSACATPPLPNESKQGGVEAAFLANTNIVKHSVEHPEVAALWTNAEISRHAEKIPEAADFIEKALRIVPDDPVLWSRLAEFRLRAGDFVLAENYAAKSNALAPENRVLLYRNWLIVQYSRDQRGDVLGAREAQLEVRKFKTEE